LGIEIAVHCNYLFKSPCLAKFSYLLTCGEGQQWTATDCDDIGTNDEQLQ